MAPVVAAGTLLSVSLQGVPGAHAADRAGGTSACPDVVVVAARGSDQNDPVPTSYSPESPWVSNGYEGPNIQGMIQLAESRHREQTGQSLMRNVHVLAIDDTVYPAVLGLPPLAEQGELRTLEQLSSRLVVIHNEEPLPEIAVNAGPRFLASIRSGMEGTLGYIDAWEAETGCRPGYVLVGYSQGAAVLTAQESALAERGRLIGSLYLGNPLMRPGDPAVIGAPESGHGLLSSLPVLPAQVAGDFAGLQGASESRRLNYCATADVVCDLTPESVGHSLTTAGGVHIDYFLYDGTTPTDADIEVVDTFAEWVSGYTRQA